MSIITGTKIAKLGEKVLRKKAKKVKDVKSKRCKK